VCRFGKACRTGSSSRREIIPKTAAGVAEVSLILCFIWATARRASDVEMLP